MNATALQSLSTSAVREIALTNGNVALVDAADFGWLSQWSWGVNRNGYAVRYKRSHGAQDCILMHRLIIAAPPGLLVDHANRVRLDNRRQNLRLADFTQNMINRAQPNNTGFRGVRRERGRFQARIKPLGIPQINLGFFLTAEDAARAYDAAARRLHGHFAQLNFPEPTDAAAPGEDRRTWPSAREVGAAKASGLADRLTADVVGRTRK